MPTMPTTPPPEGPPPGWLPPQPDPRAPYGRPAQGPYAGPPMPPPQGYGFQQPYQQQYPPQQQVPTQASYTEWWWDGHKWRPPVPRMSRGQALAQLPGVLIKLIFLLFLLGIILAAFGIVK